MTVNFSEYDKGNIFAKILAGSIPCNKVYENEYALAFFDIQPQASKHILVIPKGEYVSSQDFYVKASHEEIIGFHACISEVTAQEGLNIEGNEKGYRLISNAGIHGGQEVPHFHVHILGGQKLGTLLGK